MVLDALCNLHQLPLIGNFFLEQSFKIEVITKLQVSCHLGLSKDRQLDSLL